MISILKGRTRRPKGSTKEFLSKLSKSFMLPISVLPVAGLLLGIGGAIGANCTAPGAIDFANFLKGMSDPIFGNLAILFAAAIAMSFTEKNKLSAVFMTIISYLIFSGVQSAFIHFNPDGSFKDVFYFHQDDDIKYLIASNLGIRSLQTSIFGGIFIGGLVSYAMNRWSEYELPLILNFFSGVRLVPILLMPLSATLAIIFLIFWPWVGQGIAWFGNVTAGAPAGVDGLLYGMLTRALMPFGLHHIVIGMAFQSSLGGELTIQQINEAGVALGITNDATFQALVAEFTKDGRQSIVGDQNIWNFINSLPINRMPINATGATEAIFPWFADHVGVYAGRYTQDYATYIGACLGIGAAMIMAADKDKRKRAIAMIGSSMFVAFLTGITEPLEFSFLFIAPWFYYGIYVPVSGLSYMLMKVLGAHVGVGFARGFMDLMIYGAVPVAKGTNFWWAFPIAAGEAAITWSTFYFAIKKWNLQTPGRGSNDLVLINKAKYNELKEGAKSEVVGDKKLSKSSKTRSKDQELEEYVAAYGGVENLAHVTACATRLRISVKNPKLIDKELLKVLGSKGFIENGNASQNILGGKAAIIANKINDKYGEEIK